MSNIEEKINYHQRMIKSHQDKLKTCEMKKEIGLTTENYCRCCFEKLDSENKQDICFPCWDIG